MDDNALALVHVQCFRENFTGAQQGEVDYEFAEI